MPSGPNFSSGSYLEARQLVELSELMRDVLKSRMVSGRGVHLAHMPDGVMPRVAVATVTGIQHNFQVRLEEDEEGKIRVRVAFGLVEGIEPVIGDRRISEPDENGEVPYLTVSPGDFAPRGNCERALIYLRYTLSSPSGAVSKVEPVASSRKPEGKPWIWHRLLAILIRKDKDSPATVSQQLFFNQGFTLTNIKGGYGTPWPRSQP
jgi:hypothetical protein